MIKYQLTQESNELLSIFTLNDLVKREKFNEDQLKRIEQLTGIAKEFSRLILTTCPKTGHRDSAIHLCESVIKLCSASIRLGEGGPARH